MADVRLTVGGQEYGGWKTMRVSRSLDAIAGGFELGVSERWHGQQQLWPIRAGDACGIALEGEVVLAGYVDGSQYRYDADTHTVTVTGRDASADLVDCSADLGVWELLATPLGSLASRLGAQFGIPIAIQGGVTLPPPPAKQTITPGDSAFEVLERACRFAGVLPMADGRGGVVLTRAGTTRVPGALVEGDNILSASLSHDASQRYARYIVTGQRQGSDEDFGEPVAGVRGEAQDAGVARSVRLLRVQADGDVTIDYARRRAAWEAAVRAARADQVVITVQGWRHAGGALWPLNALVPVRSPRLAVDGDLLITQVVYALSQEAGTTTELTLQRPDAYMPEPIIPPAGSVGRISALDGVR